MRLILETSTKYCHKNLLISNKVAIIILDEYSDANFHNIVFMEYYMPNEPL